MTFNGSLNGGKKAYTMGGVSDERDHMCGACMNPHTKAGNPECKNAPKPRPSQTVPYYPESPYGDDLDDIDDDWEPDPWARADEIHDRERDERLFNDVSDS